MIDYLLQAAARNSFPLIGVLLLLFTGVITYTVIGGVVNTFRHPKDEEQRERNRDVVKVVGFLLVWYGGITPTTFHLLGSTAGWVMVWAPLVALLALLTWAASKGEINT